MYALIVLEAGITPDYFLDSMQMYEVKAVLENLQYKNKTSWEQARMISYIIAQTNSTKQLSPTDIMKFDWDEVKEKDTSISKDDIARLQAFNNNIVKSSRQVQEFQQITGNIVGTIGKFAAGIGIATTASDAFMKIIRSSQATNDEWDNTLNSCKGTVDLFFQSMSAGSFEAFNNGVLSTIRNLKELSALRDSLTDAKLSMGFNTKVFETEFTKYESIIRDTTKSKQEREKAFKDLQKLKDDFKIDVTDVLGGAEEELIQSLNIRTGRKDFNINDIHKYISINNNDFSSRNEKRALTEYQDQLKAYEKEINQIQGRINSTRGDTNEWTGETKKQMREKLSSIKQQMELFKQQNSELEKQNFLNQDNDANRGEMIKNYEYAYDLKKRMYDFDKRTLELQNSLKPAGGNNKVKTEEVIPAGSVAELDKLITEARKKYAAAITDDARVSALKLIQELEQKKIVLNITAKYNSREQGDLKPAGIPSVKGFNSRDIGKLTSPFVTEEDVKVNNDYATSLGAIATVMGSISQMTNEGASAWLTWSANLMTAIGTAIPAIEALIAAKKAESIGNAVASATQTPVVGWLLAGAAVASVIAAFATMPQFANGGVVDGSSFFGDKILARVNSGEMILNKSQQSNLFNLLDGGSPVKGGAMSGEVEFKISDKALVGVLKQHNNRTNRLR